MAEEWLPGDVVLCVRKLDPNRSLELRVGHVDTIERVTGAGAGLFLEEVKSPTGRPYRRLLFVKINPLTDQEREEALRDLKAPAPPSEEPVE